MHPEHMRFGGGPSQTVLNPVVAIVMLAAVVLMFSVRRRFVVAPLLAAGMLIPMDQVVVIGGFHFQMIRLLIICGWARMVGLRSSSNLAIFTGGMNSVDKVVIAGAVFTALDGTMLFGNSGALVNQLGTLYTTLGIYCLLRFFIRDDRDIETAITSFVYIAAVIAVVMTIEQATGRNPYTMLGGFRATATKTLMARDDKFRAMACFSHPILAGTFGATLFPLCLALWFKDRKHRITAVIGIVAATIITLAADSSTPILAYGAVLGGMLLWPIRDKMRTVRWGIVAVLVGLHLWMKAPVWSLIARVDIINGSSGYHRYMLVDQFIRRFGDWWMFGTSQNADWGWDMWDLANQYVAIGESSGLLPFVFFIATISYGFKLAGQARRRFSQNKRNRWFFWMLGVGMLAHVVAFFGISYFDQTQILWYAFLSMLSVCTIRARSRAVRTSTVPAPQPAPEMLPIAI